MDKDNYKKLTELSTKINKNKMSYWEDFDFFDFAFLLKKNFKSLKEFYEISVSLQWPAHEQLNRYLSNVFASQTFDELIDINDIGEPEIYTIWVDIIPADMESILKLHSWKTEYDIYRDYKLKIFIDKLNKYNISCISHSRDTKNGPSDPFDYWYINIIFEVKDTTQDKIIEDLSKRYKETNDYRYENQYTIDRLLSLLKDECTKFWAQNGEVKIWKSFHGIKYENLLTGIMYLFYMDEIDFISYNNSLISIKIHGDIKMDYTFWDLKYLNSKLYINDQIVVWRENMWFKDDSHFEIGKAFLIFSLMNLNKVWNIGTIMPLKSDESGIKKTFSNKFKTIHSSQFETISHLQDKKSRARKILDSYNSSIEISKKTKNHMIELVEK